MSNFNSFLGDQIGAYFGYALAAGDFNGDGLADLAIGAPLYSVDGKYENGRVYVMYQSQKVRITVNCYAMFYSFNFFKKMAADTPFPPKP